MLAGAGAETVVGIEILGGAGIMAGTGTQAEAEIVAGGGTMAGAGTAAEAGRKRSKSPLHERQS